MTQPNDRSPHISGKARRLHDLRQPLAAILAAATALQSELPVDEPMRAKLLKIIVDNVIRLTEMLEDPGAND